MSDRSALKRSTLAFRHLLEGYRDDGTWVPGDLELVLRGYGIFRDRAWLDPNRLSHLGDEGLTLRRSLEEAIEALIPALPGSEQKSPSEALQGATDLYIREAAYTWFNRLVALRCLEARVPGVDEAIKVKPDYAGRSLRHDRFCRQYPELGQGEDGGLAAFLREVCAASAQELPLLFDPDSPLTLITPSPDTLQKCVRALSGEKVSLTRSASDIAEGLSDDVFREPDLLGWIYQYWNTEEKDRVFEAAARGKKIEGADIIPATCIYTEDYMVRFLVENALGALWVEMHPDSRLPEQWQYFVRDAERRPRELRPVTDLTFLDPACGSGHFLVYAFDLLWDMYHAEGRITDPAEICRSILERNLYGIDIDERSVQIAAISLYLKAKERAPHFTPQRVNLVAANASVPPDAVRRYLQAHPEDRPLHGVLESICEGLENVGEVGSLLQVEEQLDRALHELRKQEARRAKDGPEQISMLPLLGLRVPPTQGQLNLDMLPPLEVWKPAVLDRLHRQFQQEADAKDLSTAIFGSQAEKGLDLIELLSRRYDVVAANPPYMGSKNMGQLLKTYVQRHYPQGKRDLYAAFIQRCPQLAEYGGKVAMVTQQSWMFLRSFTELRKGVLEQQTIECLAHLGEHGFEDPAAAGAFVVLFVLTQAPPGPEHRLWAVRLVDFPSPRSKADAIRSGAPLRVFQYIFTLIPDAPIAYWLPSRLVATFDENPALGKYAICTDGANGRDFIIRFAWEIYIDNKRWFLYSKGGGHKRWTGLEVYVYDYEYNGSRIKAYIDKNYKYLGGKYGFLLKHEDLYGKRAWTFSDFARGRLDVREHRDGTIPGHTGPIILPPEGVFSAVAAYANSRLASALLSAFTTLLHIMYTDVSRLPWRQPSNDVCKALNGLVQFALTCAGELTSRDPIEYRFRIVPIRDNVLTLTDTVADLYERDLVLWAMLSCCEKLMDNFICELFELDNSSIAYLEDTLGFLPGERSLVYGYDALPNGLDPLPQQLIDYLCKHKRASMSSDQLARIKDRLRALCLVDSIDLTLDGEDSEGEIDQSVTVDDEGLEVAAVRGKHVPSQSFLDTLSQEIGIHPLSLYWLLKELRQQAGVLSPSELRRYIEDYFTVMMLRLLGHRWPKQVEVGEPIPEWAAPDGIIPLTDGTGQRTLLDRVRERIAVDFGEARVDAIEQEFRQIMGRSLADWLARDFFPRHISQFKRRPMAWLLESGRAVDIRWETTRGRRSRRSARSGGPAFACLVYYHKLTADSLTRIKTHYLRPVLQRREFELAEERRRAAEGNTAARASAERLAEIIDELNAFEAALDTISTQGFSSRRLVDLLNKEEPDSWTCWTPHSPIPDKEAFMHQEQAYDPDINDGVRVNIAPLQKYGLLAADVLAKKDMDRAIEDRAVWRADERRWCREGKLPKPGWWQDRD